MTSIGIDLGTTNSLVAYLAVDGPVTIPNELGDHLTPSAVAVADDGSILVGRSAKDRLVTAPNAGRAFFKRDMGTSARYEFGKRSWTPTELSAAILKEMKRIASAHLNEEVDRAVITVPAYFHDPERQATMAAAAIAGLKVDAILNEPTAAALAFGYRAGPELRRVLVFDLGGGTFDVTVLEMFEGVIEVKASGGDSRLGGEDYTDGLLKRVLELAHLDPAPAERSRLRQRVEVAKRKLAAGPTAMIEIDGKEIPLERRDFEAVCAPITARLRPVVMRCLRDAGIVASDLDDVLLVGGASRMPIVHSIIGETFGRIANRGVDPDRVVALGAAIRAAQAEGKESVREIVLTDVCAHSLGVEVSRELSPGHHEHGYFLPILDRNTPVPVSRSESLHTLRPEQDTIELGIYQGENRRISENTPLGKLRIAGLRTKPGQRHPGQFDVRFSYDANGILEVEVTILETRRMLSKVIESRPGQMTPVQIEEAIRRLAPLKAHPRDSLQNRARLERAHRVYAELIGDARAHFSETIDRFEMAIEAQDPQMIGFTGAVLDAELAAFYKGEDERQEFEDPPFGRPADRVADDDDDRESADDEEGGSDDEPAAASDESSGPST